MTTRFDDALLRRYLLGSLTDQEAEQIEDEYFAQPDALDHLTAVESDLIDEYVAGQLTPAEHAAFDERFRDSPRHRLRLAVSRTLRAEATASRAPVPIESHQPRRPTLSRGWPVIVRVGVAAAAIAAIATNAWILRSTLPNAPRSANTPVTSPPIGSEPERPSPDQPIAPPDARATPRVIALTLSPIHVRTAGAAAMVAIPPGTDLVVVRLQGEATDGDLSGTAVVRTVAGVDLWRGAAIFESGRPPDARVEIPAGVLRADDYVIELLGRDAGGREFERYSYFFSVRQNER